SRSGASRHARRDDAAEGAGDQGDFAAGAWPIGDGRGACRRGARARARRRALLPTAHSLALRSRLAVLLDELAMRRHVVGGLADRLLDVSEPSAQLVFAHHVDQRIVAARADVLTDHDREPARIVEELVVLAEDAAAVSEQIHLVLEEVGDAHVAAVVPERRVVALGRLVVEHDEIADPLELPGHYAVVLLDLGRREPAIRK